MSKNQLVVLDKVGMCTSLICMIHCLSIPLFIILGFDTALRFFDQEWVELMIITTAFIIGMISFLGGFMKHRQHFIPVLFVAGFLLIVNGESVLNEWTSVSLSVAGALVIGYAHFQNLRWRRHVSAY